jgi:hypothetical protein
MARHVEHKRLRLLRVMLTEPEWERLRRMCRAAGLDMSSLVRHCVFDDRSANHGDAIRPSAA